MARLSVILNAVPPPAAPVFQERVRFAVDAQSLQALIIFTLKTSPVPTPFVSKTVALVSVKF